MTEDSSFIDIEKTHWEENWSSAIDNKPSSKKNIFNYDIDRLLRRELGDRKALDVVEIGSAPGKMLLHVERNFGARCVGLDYSEVGCAAARRFLAANGSAARMICKDVLEGPVEDLEADFTYSIGVVEHFADPTAMVDAHLRLLRPGGKAMIVLPNYSGANAALQRRLDPENLAIHNLAMMNPEYWQKHMDKWPDAKMCAFRFGRPSPWMFSLSKLGGIGRLISYATNFAMFAMPDMQIMPSMMVIVYERKQ